MTPSHPNDRECCEKCKQISGFLYSRIYCSNPNCPCHSTKVSIPIPHKVDDRDWEKRQAMILVNRLYELAELTVAKRQSINDKADEITIAFLAHHLEAERGRIEAVFIREVPPHKMDLEDSIWLKRVLNKAFPPKDGSAGTVSLLKGDKGECKHDNLGLVKHSTDGAALHCKNCGVRLDKEKEI